MSEYSDDLASLFRPDEEAMFFGNVAEMCARLEGVLIDDTRRRQIAAAGMERVWRDGHDVASRMKTLLGWAEEIAGNSW
jgi:spore maturation protein CgeB